MADFLPGRQTRVLGVEAGAVFVGEHESEFVFGQGTQIFPNLPVPIYGVCSTRMVSDANEKWFEFSYRIDHAMSGNAAAGWTDAGNYFRIEPQWSLDLVNWSMGKFLPAPVPVVDLGGGVFEYWARAIHPQDSQSKNGQIVCSSVALGGDTRNNPLTGIVIGSVTQTLPNFPYTMPGSAAQLQTDLRAAGWAGATVTASSAVIWAITIPVVSYTSYGHTSSVSWTPYVAGTDPFGNSFISSGMSFSGALVDPAGTAIHGRAFARLKITAGTRYNAYH